MSANATLVDIAVLQQLTETNGLDRCCPCKRKRHSVLDEPSAYSDERFTHC